MKIFIALSLLLLASQSLAEEKIQIRNVRFETAGEKVIVHYDLGGPSDWEYKVGITLRKENKKVFAYTPRYVSGDVGQGHFAGSDRQIVWDSRKEFTAGLDTSDFYFEVSAEPVEHGGMGVWIGVGAAVIAGGGIAAILLSKNHEEPPSVFPGPPGRPPQ